MCNPRHIRVRATTHLAQAWDQEVRRQVTLRGAATGRAGVRESLSASLGIPVLSALDRVLDGLEGWQPRDGGYRHAVDGGYLHYHPGTGELEIVAEASADVEAQGQAQTTVSGTVEETLEAEGVGRFYDDGWGGLNEDTARRDAEADAQRELDAAAAQRLAAARSQADAEAGGAVQEQANAAARQALAARTAARTAELERQAADQLATVGVQARALFHQALAQAYRDAILAYARSRNAEGVQLSGSDGVLEIQFEMEI
jgi:hypothetical protein